METYFHELTPETVSVHLREAGLACEPHEIQFERREERWVALLAGGFIAWFPASQEGSRRLAVERRVLSLLTNRCSFRVPEPLFVSDTGIDVRLMVPGRCEPWNLYERCQADFALTKSLGHAIGDMLAEQHTRVRKADIAGWLSCQVAWPQPSDWICERLPLVIGDVGFARVLGQVIESYEALEINADDRVLVHGDLGFHNIALDPATDAVNGIFDYDAAAWADRHHDFRYLLFDVEREDLLDAALQTYQSNTARAIDRDRLRLYNAACAISFLALRSGTDSDQKSCGRTLAEDLHWVRTALAKLHL